MSVSKGLVGARELLAAVAPVAEMDDPLCRDAVARLGAALRGFGPFEQVGWVEGDTKTGSLRVLVLPTMPGARGPVVWGEQAAGSRSLHPGGETRICRDEAVGTDPVAALLGRVCDRVLVVPFPLDTGDPVWLVAGWSQAAGDLDEETTATLALLQPMLGPSVKRRRRPASPAPAAAFPALSSLHNQQIAIAGRWASIGTLAGGVIHEINNPATFIALAAGQIEKGVMAAKSTGDASKLEQLTELTAGIQDATRQIRGLVADFRQFVGGAGKASMLTVDLERVLMAAGAMTKAAHRHDAVLKMGIEPIPPCPGRFLAIGPAVVAILVNAIESLADGPGPRQVSLQARAVGDCLEVSVEDTGAGIAPEHMAHVFDPFFTTKSPQAHAGLGLTAARSAMESLRGTVEIESELGVGTRLTLTVPME
jgi:signal transduction histidine kinase